MTRPHERESPVSDECSARSLYLFSRSERRNRDLRATVGAGAPGQRLFICDRGPRGPRGAIQPRRIGRSSLFDEPQRRNRLGLRHSGRGRRGGVSRYCEGNSSHDRASACSDRSGIGAPRRRRARGRRARRVHVSHAYCFVRAWDHDAVRGNAVRWFDRDAPLYRLRHSGARSAQMAGAIGRTYPELAWPQFTAASDRGAGARRP